MYKIIKEADKVIAKYTGVKIAGYKKSNFLMSIDGTHSVLDVPKYSKSFDCLIPVWKKLYCTDDDKMYNPNEIFFIMVRELMEKSKRVLLNDRSEHGASHLSICEAVAIATASEIQSINNTKE